MKKALALLTALMLLAVAPLALVESVRLTENATGFDVTINLPDKAAVNVQTEGDIPYTFINFTDKTLPEIYISVAPTEEYDEQSLADLSKDDLDHLFAITSGDLDKPSYSMQKTPGGYDYMLIEDDSVTDSAILVILYDGYFIQMSVWNSNYSELDATDMTTATDIFDSLSIIPAN